MKKLISVILLTCLLISSLPGIFAYAGESEESEMNFIDVEKGKWYYDNIKYVYDNGYMTGVTDKTFAPSNPLTRAMFITILGRMAGAEQKESETFPDVKSGSWYSGYVSWAKDLGIVDGFPDGSFKPMNSITREQMAVAVLRYLNAMGLNTSTMGGIFTFGDESKIGSWALDSIRELRKSGIFQGDKNRNFNPKNNVTRAETATVIKNIMDALDGVWNGYDPMTADENKIFPAKYMFWNGSIYSGGMERKLVDSDGYPALEIFMDKDAAARTFLFQNTTGISVSYLRLDVKTYPYVRIAYKSEGFDTDEPEFRYNVNKTKTEQNAAVDEKLDILLSGTEGEMNYVIIDMNQIDEKYPNINYATQVADLLIIPCSKEYEGEGSLKVKYYAFFKNEDDAKAFDVSADPEMDSFFKDYTLKSDINWSELTDEAAADYDELLYNRINEIKNTESELTPDYVKARGGTCYYISSIHGDDKNDGLSPEKPFRTLEKLWTIKAQGRIWQSNLKAGDGIFLERGSVFYPKRYHDNSISTLTVPEGVCLGAYGTGPKPLLTCCFDFTEKGNTGTWLETGYPNVWALDEIDSKEGWTGQRSEICSIYFNFGEYNGLRIANSAGESTQTLGEGMKSTRKGLFYNGFEYFESEKRDLTNPGTALLHNLEFFHDYDAGKLYLYFDKGNPGDYFDDIKVTRNGTCAWTSGNIWVDNIAFVYSSLYGARSDGMNVKYTNNEVGCVGGSLSSIESGIEIYGISDGAYYYNNYVHDIGDGPLSSQHGGQEGCYIKNVQQINNVIVCSGDGVEIFGGGDVDENGYLKDKIIDCLIKDNLIAYCGYGLTSKQGAGYEEGFFTGSGINGSMYGEFVNSRIENNTFLYNSGNIFYCYVATYDQPRGWEAYGNTYVVDNSQCAFIYSYETLNYINHGMWKRARIFYPFSYEGIAWAAAQGVDPKGTFLIYKNKNPMDSVYTYLNMTGYMIEHKKSPIQ